MAQRLQRGFNPEGAHYLSDHPHKDPAGAWPCLAASDAIKTVGTGYRVLGQD